MLGDARVGGRHERGPRYARPPGTKADIHALTYDNFVGVCAGDSFTSTATGHLSAVGPVSAEGSTRLNGIGFDTYTLDLGTGPASFPTTFDRTFAPPPPASSTYVFEFMTTLRQGETTLGQSVTRISCTSGVFAAVNLWTPSPTGIPAGGPVAWAMLAALLAAAGALRLARRRA